MHKEGKGREGGTKEGYIPRPGMLGVKEERAGRVEEEGDGKGS